MSDREPPRRLTRLPTDLIEDGYEAPGDYRVIREKAVNHELGPDVFQINGIWHYCPGKRSAIAEALRLKKMANA